jgi:acyl dehydratase
VAVNPEYAGRVYPPSAGYQVGREKIREFAAAIGSDDPAHHDPEAARRLGYRDLVAPVTFAVIIAQQCEEQLISDPEAGIDFSRVVHGEEKFRHHRPIVAGDELIPTLHVDSINNRGGLSMVTTRVELVDLAGEPVSTVVSTIVVRGE